MIYKPIYSCGSNRPIKIHNKCINNLRKRLYIGGILILCTDECNCLVCITDITKYRKNGKSNLIIGFRSIDSNCDMIPANGLGEIDTSRKVDCKIGRCYHGGSKLGR